MRIRYLFLLCSILSLPLSCLVKKTAAAPDVKNTKWMLISLGDRTVKTGELNSSLHFGSNNEINAVAVCNTISGNYVADPGKMSLHCSALIISYLGCHDLKTEAVLLNALKTANQYVIKKDTLILLHNDKQLATYKKTGQR